MKRQFLIATLALALAVPTLALAASDYAQQQAAQRVQQSKLKLDAAKSAEGAARDKLMQEHMALMSQAMKEMHGTRPAKDMTPEQMREWIDEHMKLMDQMMSQMMDGEKMMMGSMKGDGGMMKK
jgi:uncharacterized protein YicC (UPF0701 family)